MSTENCKLSSFCNFFFLFCSHFFCWFLLNFPHLFFAGGLFHPGDESQEIAFRSAVDTINKDKSILPRSKLTVQIERISPQDSFHASKRGTLECLLLIFLLKYFQIREINRPLPLCYMKIKIKHTAYKHIIMHINIL